MKFLIFFLFLIVSGCKTMSEGPRVWVQKHDGSVQCEQGGATELSQDEQILKDLNVKVFSSKKDSDGMMRITLCGSPTGNVNAFEILEKDLEKASAQGFKKKE